MEEALEILDGKQNVAWYITVTCADDELSQRVEPGAPPTSERLEWAVHLAKMGYMVIIAFNPLVEKYCLIGNTSAARNTSKRTFPAMTLRSASGEAGHTLALSIEGAEKITKVPVKEADIDKGYRGHDYKGTAVIRIAGTSNEGLRWSEKKRKRRRSSIEPVIGHLKSDHRLDRCFLKGRMGDKLNLIGSAAGFNVRKLLRLLGTGIFSHALLVWAGFCRLLSSGARRFGVFTAA